MQFEEITLQIFNMSRYISTIRTKLMIHQYWIWQSSRILCCYTQIMYKNRHHIPYPWYMWKLVPIMQTWQWGTLNISSIKLKESLWCNSPICPSFLSLISFTRPQCIEMHEYIFRYKIVTTKYYCNNLGVNDPPFQ